MEATQQAPAAERERVLSKAVAETARYLDVRDGDLGGILGVSQASANRLRHGNYRLNPRGKEWELGAMFVRVYRSLFSLVGGNQALARKWLGSPNQAFGDRVPLEMLKSAEGLVDVCRYLDAHRAPI